MILTPRLMQELNIQHFIKKGTKKTAEPAAQEIPAIGKAEFRLLVKMLQAIGHDCQHDNITNKGDHIIYQHPAKTLIFKDHTLTDNTTTMYLASLTNMLEQPELKRPVWNKLKLLK
ncbi:MAG: hypothetical protein L3J52_03065 [Proteobacteria bacterium]|nr:hypothetical protein [Pseudomonadota bacterium]